MDDIGRYAVVSAGFGIRVAGTIDWDAPTPCSDWSVSDLVAHVVDTHRRVLEAQPWSGPLPRQWRTAQTTLLDALHDPERAATPRPTFAGESTFAAMVGSLVCADVLLHTWDLARATGQDEALDPDAVEECRAFLEPMDEGLRVPGGFGPRLEPPPGADAQTAFLAFAGRRA